MLLFRLVIFLLLVCTSPSRAHADVLEDWLRVADRGPNGAPLPPPLQGRLERTAPPLVSLAMFEATNAVDPRYRSYLGIAKSEQPASGEAAAAVAAHTVLVGLYPERRAQLDGALALSLSGLPAGARLEHGLEVGRRAGAAALARSLFDAPAGEPYRPAGEIGRFTPPNLPAFAPWFMRAQPFFLTSWDEVMSPPPPPTAGERYARDFEEVRLLGGVGQANATGDSLRRAQFMAQFNVDPTVSREAARRERLVDRARLWALVRMASLDANAAVAQAKMKYMTWRPLGAIRNADRDDNPATVRDPLWEPVMATPNHPEYPCGHCAFSGLFAALLEPETAKGPIEVASESAPLPVNVRFADWSAFLDATSLARIQGGMHFRFSNEEGQALGRRVGLIARERFAPPLEP
ncbi:vanadium-dependent haloperoxidase [Brevundimonas sp. BR2-1]|uniref:vanadium-dependent haloperoxidase n=1 Tax=unclassified Brevundimonas TaxID=2622653 RepID=UPI0025BA7059|nr:vanadium-dependent haloperoxidase [Brevundimonas sp. UBA7664]